MYEFVTHTWNTIKGACYHNCTYCYMKRWGALNPVRFDARELKTDLGTDNFIFVGSSCDMWAENIPETWIKKTLEHCDKFDNKYLFQTKNPANIRRILPHNSNVCVTLESNRFYPEIMANSPRPDERVTQARLIRHPLFITIEPVLDFDLDFFVKMLKVCAPAQVNIGAATGGHKLPEPEPDKLVDLITQVQEFTAVHFKTNLNRLFKQIKN